MQTTTVQMIAEVRAKAEHVQDVATLFIAFAEHIRQQPGCESVDLYRQTEDPAAFVAVISFTDEDALAAHLDNAWRQQIVQTAGDWIEGRPRRFTMQRLA